MCYGKTMLTLDGDSKDKCHTNKQRNIQRNKDAHRCPHSHPLTKCAMSSKITNILIKSTGSVCLTSEIQLSFVTTRFRIRRLAASRYDDDSEVPCLPSSDSASLSGADGEASEEACTGAA